MKKNAIINFCSGPAKLPKPVYEKAAQSIIEYGNSGLSILELSHRSNYYEEINANLELLIRQLYGIGSDYAVIFTTGGASMQFSQVPYNLLSSNATAAYLNTGIWAKKAIFEANMFGKTTIVASSEDKNFAYIPKNFEVPSNCIYLHITTNNTVEGTQIHEIPTVSVPIVADMSSDIFSKPMQNLNKFGLIYAGAQKNIGAAGLTLLIIKKDMLNKTNRVIPTMLDYRTQIEHKSLYNTPPVFATYICYLTMQWIAEQGLEHIEKTNTLKANMLYNEINRNTLFEPISVAEDRSTMNVTFRLKNNLLEPNFVLFAKQNNCLEIKGHRTFGGLRASLYNAMTINEVKSFIEVMQHFENNNQK